MYRYDEFDAQFVAERVEQFRGQVARRLSGELNEDQFKPLRLMNGLYLQLHAYMLRIAVPYGTLASRQMRKLAHIARKYDKGYGHFTTRQNIQFNWPKLVDVPDIDDLTNPLTLAPGPVRSMVRWPSDWRSGRPLPPFGGRALEALGLHAVARWCNALRSFYEDSSPRECQSDK